MQTTKIFVDVVDSEAKIKLNDLGIRVDKLSKQKVSVKADVDENTIRSVERLTDGLGGLVTITKDYDKKTSELKSTVVSATKDYQAEERELKKLSATTKETGKETEDLGKKQEETSHKTDLLRGAFMRLGQVLITSVSRGFRSALDEMKAVDTQLVVVRKVTDASAEQLTALRDRAYEVGKAYGVVASDYLNAAAQFSRAGYKEQAGDLAELATKLQLVGDVNQDVANQFLIATDKAYKLDGNYQKLSKTIDQLNEIDNNFATSIEKIAQGMGIVAPIASQAHVSAEELAAAIGTITATTQRSGSEAARAFRAIALNIIGDTKTEIEDGAKWTAGEIEGLRDVLKLYAKDVVDAAEATGQVINPMEAVAALADSYEKGILTEAKLFEMVSDIGGKLRSSQLMALIQNWDMYNDMLEKTANAAGSADREVSNALDSWEVKLNILKNTFTDFVQKTLSTNTIKGFLDALSWLISSFDNLGNVVLILGLTQLPRLITSFGNMVKVFGVAKEAGVGFVTTLMNYNKVAPLAAEGSKAVEAGMNGISTSASAASIAVAAVVAVLTIAIMWYNSAKKAQKENAEQSQKAAEQALNNAKSLEALYKRYKDAKDGSEEQRKASERLAEQLKIERSEVDSLSDAYKRYTNSVSDSYEDAISKAHKATYDSERLLKSAVNPFITGETFGGNSFTIGSRRKINMRSVYDERAYNLNGDPFGLLDLEKRFNGAEATAENLLSLVDAVSEIVSKMQREATKTGDETIYNNPLYRQSELFLKRSEEAVKSYNEAYNAEVKAVVARDAFNDSTIKSIRTQEQFNDALNKGTDVAYRGYADAWKELLYEMYPEFDDRTKEAIERIERQTAAFAGLSDEVSAATSALQKYKEALEGAEKGDAFSGYADAYKDALELYNKGLTGTNQYKSAIDLIISDDMMQKLGWNYEQAGEMLGNKFFSALFNHKENDFGAFGAQFLRENAEAYEDFITVVENGNDEFSISIEDARGLAEALGVNEEVVWALADAWDAHNSSVALSTRDIEKLKEEYADANTGLIDLKNLMLGLVNDGKTKGEIVGIVQALDNMGLIDSETIPENLGKAIEELQTLKEQAESEDLEIKVTLDPDDAVGAFQKEIRQMDGTTITYYIDFATKGSKGNIDYLPNDRNGSYVRAQQSKNKSSVKTHSGSGGRLLGFDEVAAYSVGVTSANAGLALVNEEGPELIRSGNRAYIANDGKPAVVNLKTGDRVYTADETQEMYDPRFAGSRTQRPDSSQATARSANGAYGFSFTTPKSDGGGKDGSGGGSSKSKGKEDEPDLLKLLDDYIKGLLDKAKKALDEQTDAIDAQIEALKNERKAEEEKNELEELRLKILEAEKKLVDANVERTVRYYNEETGQWEWMADQKAVSQSQKALEDAQQAYLDKIADIEYEAKLKELEAQKDALKSNYDELKSSWDDIKDSIKQALSDEDVMGIAEILSRLGLTTAGDSVGGVKTLIEAISAFSSGSFDSGGIAYGKGFLRKATALGETVLDPATTERILSPRSNAQFVSFTDSLSKLFGLSSGDIGAKMQSVFSSLDRSSSVVGDTYYINGVKIGSDMANKPLSEILSVLPIYAH